MKRMTLRLSLLVLAIAVWLALPAQAAGKAVPSLTRVGTGVTIGQNGTGAP